MGQETNNWTSFTYNKVATTQAIFYLFYKLDADTMVDEMWESNNVGYFTIHQQLSFSVPYFNDFESSISGWRHGTSFNVDEWEWGVPSGTILNSAFSGTKVWGSKLSGTPTLMSRMHLYTPIIDLTTLTDPVLEFDVLIDIRDFNMSYSVDGGASWLLLDTTNLSFKPWYYPSLNNNSLKSSLLLEVREDVFQVHYLFQGKDNLRNTRYILDLKFLQNQTAVQFRYNLAVSDAVEPLGGMYNYGDEGVVIDNFEIRQKFYDLTVANKKALMYSSLKNLVNFDILIKNDGNYISDSTTVNFYLSIDSVLDGFDQFIGTNIIEATRPDMAYYITTSYPVTNLSNYVYLIYEIDPLNVMVESDEVNNIGAWPLALDSVSSYPYFNEFNDTVVHGWKPYCSNPDFRMRHLIAPGEGGTGRRSFEWYTDNIDAIFYSNSVPVWYLESPSFDFTGISTVHIGFNLYCLGSYGSGQDKDGANLDYSLDGGNTWNLLGIYNDPNSDNWYNLQDLVDFDGNPGWSKFENWFQPTTYDASSILANQSDVVFRFKFSSVVEPFGNAGKTQGFRIDNFAINTTGPFFGDFMALEVPCDTIVVLDTAQEFEVTYSFTNTGNQYTGYAATQFFWVTQQDTFTTLVNMTVNMVEDLLAPGDTSVVTVSILYPTQLCDTAAVLYYSLDVPTQFNPLGSTMEPNENNNIGCFYIELPSNAVDAYITVSDTTVCNGDEVILSATPGYYYNWSTGETTDSIITSDSGTFWVQVKKVGSWGCIYDTDTIEVAYSDFDINVLSGGFTGFCLNDSLVLTAGGDPAISYLWSTGDTSNSITIDTAGFYNVSAVNSFGCVITTPSLYYSRDTLLTPGLSFILGNSNFCSGDSAVVTVPTADSYLWSTNDTSQNISVFNTGIYFVTVGNSCGTFPSDTLSIQVWALPDISISISGNTTMCDGDSVVFTAMSNYTYLWTNGYTSQSIVVYQFGFFQVSLTDSNGCQLTSDQIQVITYPNPISTISYTGSSNVCDNDSLLLSAVLGYDGYLWSTGDTNETIYVSDSGEYYVTTTNSYGCSEISPVVQIDLLNAPDPPVVTLMDSIITSTNQPNYQWYYNGMAIPGAIAQIIGASIPGEYYVEVQSPNGCRAASNTIYFGINAISNPGEGLIWRIYPNPTSGLIHIEVTLEAIKDVTVSVHDMNGKKVIEPINKRIRQGKFELDLGENAPGLYYMKLITNDSYNIYKISLE